MMLELPDDIKDLVGSGSLRLDMEVDIRDEEGWVEDVTIFTHHKTEKTWFAAESDCQKEGAHLASVASDEANQAVKEMAAENDVWLGGKDELGQWTWSDSSTWGFTKWTRFGDGDCVQFLRGKWSTRSCRRATFQFICQKTKIAKGKQIMNIAYKKDQLNFSRFIVLYKYKTADQQLLDSWKNKRMTGLKFSWRIENPTLIWTSTISEVGRSLQSLQLSKNSNSPSNEIYKVILTPSEDLKQNLGHGSLVIELDVNMKPSDEVYVFTSYKVYREYKSWTDADLHCKSEGGQLASIHSQWQQTLAMEAVEGEYEDAWLGGKIVDGHWHWVDNTTWNFTNWKFFYPNGVGYLLMDWHVGQWTDASSSWERYFLCQWMHTAINERGLASFELKKDQMDLLPFHVLFKHHANDQLELGTSSEDESLTLNWYLKDNNGAQVTKRLPARQDDWRMEVPTPVYREPFLHDMIQLAYELRLQNMTREDILTMTIRQKSDIPDLHRMCLMGQVKAEYYGDVFFPFVPSENSSESGDISEQQISEHSDMDIETGYELFHAVMFCHGMVFKLYTFIDDLLSNETSRTILQTTFNIFQSGAITDEKSFTLAKQFYHVLVSTLNLQYGNILLATSTAAQLQNALDSDLPFFTNNTDMVKKCLQEQHCDFLQDIHQNFGKKYIFFYFLLSCCHRRQQCLKRTIPVPSPLDSGRERESSSICTCSLLLLSRGD